MSGIAGPPQLSDRGRVTSSVKIQKGLRQSVRVETPPSLNCLERERRRRGLLWNYLEGDKTEKKNEKQERTPQDGHARNSNSGGRRTHFGSDVEGRDVKSKTGEEKSGRSPFVIIFRDVPGGEHSSRQKANHVTA